MIRTISSIARLIEPGRRWVWVLLVGLAVVASLFEAVAALLVLAVIRLSTSPDAHGEIPLLGRVLERLGVQDLGSNLPVLLLAVGGFFAARSVAVLLMSYLQGRIAFNAGARVSARLLDSYLRMPYAQYLRKNSAELVRNAHQSANEVVMYGLLPVVTIASETFVIASLVLVLLSENLAATLGAVALVGPVAVLSMKWLQPMLTRLGVESQAEARASLQTIQESLAALPEIRLVGGEHTFVSRLAAHRRAFARARYLNRFAADVPRVATETVAILFVLAFLFASSARGEASAAQLSFLGLFAYSALRIVPSISRVATSVNSLQFADAAVSDVLADLADLRQVERSEDHGSGRNRPPEGLVFRGVSFSYDGSQEHALDGIDLHLPPGGSLGIVGPTGSGKSTLVSLLLGLLEPTSGQILVDGRPLALCREEWQRSIGFVPQSPTLFDDTIRRNVALGEPEERIDDGRVLKALELAQVRDFVESLPAGLDTTVGDRGIRVSGGQRQRLVIARALYRDPPVLVFDEGTSALDSETEEAVTRALSEVRLDRTFVAVAHRTQTVRDCDTIVVVVGGRIHATGTYDDLIARSPIFRALASQASPS